MKHLYLLLLLLLAALAQGHAENVRGRVIDEHSGEPLPDATVQIVIEYARMGRSIYSLTLDSLGCFCHEVSGDDCRVEVSLIGYHSRKVHFVAMEGTDTLDLGDIRLKPSDVYLRTATVNARAKRFVMRGDTVVFNPAAFQLSEGARLDELIRQLPGVTQKDGKLYWMDKPVRILVNGEDMFADNAILQQRLPAEAVDRIKAYNKASKLAERTGRDDGEEDHVLDIQVKPSFLEKWYGSAEADYVTPDRFRALLDAMYFSMSDPFMAYANINTTGQNTFQKNYGSTSWQNAPTFGRQQFGSLGYKHAWKHPGEKKELTNQYTFCIEGQHLDTWDRSGQSRETFLTSGPNAYSLSASRSYNHQVYPRFSFSNNLELTERTQFYANASWEFRKQDAPETRRQATFEGDPYAVTDDPLEGAFAVTDAEALARGVVARSLYEAQRHTEQMKTKGWATLIHNFGKASSVSVNASADYADTQVSALALRDLRYFRSPADNVVRYEADREPGHRLKLGGGGNLKVWLGEPVLLTASYDFSYLRDFAARRHAVGDEAFASAENFPAEAIDEANSFAKRFSSGTHWMQTSLQLTLGKVKMTPRLRLSAAHENLQYHRGALDVDATRNLWLWNPALEARWNVKRGQNVELSYSYDTKAPDMLDRVDFTDDTNPLYIVEGNPMLRNSHSHSASLRYFANIMRLQQSITATLRLTKQVDPIATLLSFQPLTGAYRTQKTNVRGGYDLGLSLDVDRGFGEHIRLRSKLEGGVRRSYGFLLADFDATEAPLNRCVDNYLRLRPNLSYESDAVTVGTGVEAKLSLMRYRPSAENNQTRQDYTGWLYGKYKWRDWTFETNLTLRGHAGYAMAEMNRVIPEWTASVGRKVLAGKGFVSLSVDDILNKQRSYWAEQTATERIENYALRRHHFLLLSFRYSFDAKGRDNK